MNGDIVRLQKEMVSAMKGGHTGFFNTHDIAYWVKKKSREALTLFIHNAIKAGVLERICKGVYVVSILKPSGVGTLEALAKKIRSDYFVYVTAETELSRLGVISQLTMGYLTVMTNGRSGIFKTSYGTIEFTHTKKNIHTVMDDIWYDNDTGIYRAKESLAIRDLKRIGRNVGMLNEEVE